MSFIRPEVEAQLWRWREVLAAFAALLLGLYWSVGAHGILKWLGAVLLIVAGMGLVAGVQRARFRLGRDGPGVVAVDEGQITYFGPLDGGVVALSEISRLEIDRSANPPVWTLSQPGQPALRIPLTAAGADALFDAFALLPGLRTQAMLREMRGGGRARVVIWHREAARLH